MKRLPGAWRHTCTLSRAINSAGSSRSSASVRIIASSSAISSGRRTALSGDVADGRHQAAVAERQNLVEVAAHGIAGRLKPTTSTPGARKRPGGSIAF